MRPKPLALLGLCAVAGACLLATGIRYAAARGVSSQGAFARFANLAFAPVKRRSTCSCPLPCDVCIRIRRIVTQERLCGVCVQS